MANIKIRVSLAKGRVGIPLEKLGDVVSETQRFLKLLCRDVGISVAKGEWIASNFENNSVDFDSSYVGKYEEKKVLEFNNAMRYVTSQEPGKQITYGIVSNDTLLQYSNIAKPIDPDEQVLIGIYENGGVTPKEWTSLTREYANHIIETVQAVIEYYGTVYGVIHAFFKGSHPPYFTLRDALTGDLVKCIFEERLYKNVVSTLERRDAIVYAFGLVRANSLSRKIEDIFVSNIRPAPALTEKEYGEFFGSIPNIKNEGLYDE
jgi:hypothetical protein